MKKKYLNGFLIVVLVLIWGSVIFKYFGGADTDRNELVMSNLNSDYKYDIPVLKDTFQLKIINSNPFKATVKRKVKKTPTQNSDSYRNKRIKKPVNKEIIWPKMSYHGFVKSNDKKTKLVILKINNRLYRKREKDKINDLILVKAYADSLVLSNNQELKTIIKINERS